MIHYDAMLNEIVIGKVYGYSNNKNGFTTVTIGKAKKLTEKKVSLEVLDRKRALYENKLENDKYVHSSKTISVKGNMLFPVDISELKFG